MEQYVVLVWLACAAIGLIIARLRHQNPTQGLLLGLVLGPLGVLLVLVQKPVEPR